MITVLLVKNTTVDTHRIHIFRAWKHYWRFRRTTKNGVTSRNNKSIPLTANHNILL